MESNRPQRAQEEFAENNEAKMDVSTGFKDQSVIVTGAGSGIGRAAALKFAALGAKVLVADINEKSANAVVEEIRAVGGVAMAVIGDLSDPKVVDKIVSAAIESHGGIDVLVNNAGIMDSMSATDEVSVEEWDRVIRVNLTAPFLLSRAVLPHMLKKSKGAIVNTASEAGFRGSCAGTPYTVSKHGLIGLTKSNAIMYRNRGVRVNAVAPGGTKTNISVIPIAGNKGPEVLGAYRANMGRMAEASEVAAAIVFLASDAASDITGVVLPVDAGWSAV